MSNYYYKTHSKSTNVRVYGLGRRVFRALLLVFWFLAKAPTQWALKHLFFAPGAYRSNPEEEACLRKGRSFQIPVHDKIIQGWRWGQGPAVLMVHGWNGRGIQFHNFVEVLVKNGFTAIAIDGPSHGASTGRITSFFEFIDTVRVFLEDDRKFNVQGIIAHSFGAAAAISALFEEGKALPMVCIAPVLKLRELVLDTFEKFGIPKIVYTEIISQYEKQFGYNLESINPHALLASISAPVLIVHDEEDRTVSIKDSEEQNRLHPHISLYFTKGLGHKRILTDWDVVNAGASHMENIDIEKGEIWN